MNLKQNQRYQATVQLSGIELFASNTDIVNEFMKAGFSEVVVTGSGRQRQAVGRWPKDSISNAPIPKQVTNIKEV